MTWKALYYLKSESVLSPPAWLTQKIKVCILASAMRVSEVGNEGGLSHIWPDVVAGTHQEACFRVLLLIHRNSRPVFAKPCLCLGKQECEGTWSAHGIPQLHTEERGNLLLGTSVRYFRFWLQIVNPYCLMNFDFPVLQLQVSPPALAFLVTQPAYNSFNLSPKSPGN